MLNNKLSKTMLVAGMVAAMMSGLTANATLTINGTSAASGHFYGSSDPNAGQLAACLNINSSQLGSLIYQCNYSGSKSGTLQNSYNCQYPLNNCTIGYLNGQFANASCLIVKDSYNNCYVWNTGSSWNGTDGINLKNICSYYGHITCIEFYGKCTNSTPTGGGGNVSSVPEPSSAYAAMALLIPLGLFSLFQLRKQRAA